MNNRKINILVDNDSWILPYAETLLNEIKAINLEVKLVRRSEEIEKAWITFLLGCTKIIPSSILEKSQHNLVVHESDLPKGRGFAPMTWQIIEGKKEIPVCLIEATEEVDSGPIWIKDKIQLTGYELNNEWRHIQGEKTIELCLKFVKKYHEIAPQEQLGNETVFKRRTKVDSQIDIDKTIREQFNLLRTVNNENYPAYIVVDGNKYILKIYRDNGAY